MSVKVLDCPVCERRFNFEYDSRELPETITCPECRSTRPGIDFYGLIFCPACFTKLKISMKLLITPGIVCPGCKTVLNDNTDELPTPATSGSNSSIPRPVTSRMMNNGEVFDKHHIIRFLGSGGMAEVYLTEHLLFKQRYALKIMRCRADADAPVYIQRFLREAKISYALNHPNIVKVFDAGIDFKSGHPFIAMEYIEGKTLHQLAREHEFSEAELINVLKSMTYALNALLGVKAVHRDIKPSNIMCSSRNVYKLMDLGLAQTSGDAEKSENNSNLCSIGTPNYASPEQCRATHNVDCRSDIYSLGATIYHLASGKLPFTGADPGETIANVIKNNAVPLQQYRPDLSEKLLKLIEKMMMKNPDERPASPDELLEEIHSIGSVRK